MSTSDIERRLTELERRIPQGMMVSSTFGRSEVRPFQVGFPAVITSTFDADTGYSWSQLVLDQTGPKIDSPDVPRTGDMAFTTDNNQDLPIGTPVWLEVDPQAGGWIAVTAGGIRLPIQLTSTYSCFTGYSWQLLTRNSGSSCEGYTLSYPAVTGQNLVEIGGNISLQPGMRAIMFPDPIVVGAWMMELGSPAQSVTNVCPIFTSGTLAGIEVEYTSPDGQVTCEINPTACCVTPPIPCPCELPHPLYATITGCDNINLYNGTVFVLANSTGVFQPPGAGSVDIGAFMWLGNMDDSEVPCFSGLGFACKIFCDPTTNLLKASAEFDTGAAGGCYPANVEITNVVCSSGVFTATVTFSNWQSISGGEGVTCDAAEAFGCLGTIVVNISSELGLNGVPSSLTSYWNCCAGVNQCLEVYNSGQYTSLEDCEAGCGVSPPPPPPPPPPPSSVTVTITGLTGNCTAVNGSYTFVFNDDEYIGGDPDCGPERPTTTNCVSLGTFEITSDTAGFVSIDFFDAEGNECELGFSLSGTTTPIDLTGTGSIFGTPSCTCDGASVTITVT